MKPLKKSDTQTFHTARLLALAAGALLCCASASWAQPNDLFFSEYVEGTSFNKALEIYNGTGAAIDLGDESYSVEIYFNGNPAPGQVVALDGVVADGDVFVLAHNDSDPAILAEADQADGRVLFNGDDTVVLKRAGGVIDAIGQVGFDPGSQWGVGLVSTQNNTLCRKPEFCAGDDDASDPFDPSDEWNGLPEDSFDGLGSHTASCTAVSLGELLQRIEDLEAAVEGLELRADEMDDDLRAHTHDYLTGKGAGHNNTPASTGEAVLPE